MDQGKICEDGQSVRTVLRDFEMQTKVLKHRVSTWDTQLDMDMEARPKKCKAANEELTEPECVSSRSEYLT